MSASGVIGEEIDKQAALASAALESISAVRSSRQLPPHIVLDMLVPYSAAYYIADRVIQSGVPNPELVRTLLSRLLPFERMADDMLASARQRGYFDNPEAADPLRWLETCNEQVKDCLVALESMLDPRLDSLMTRALEEHRRGETVPLDSIP
jgi:hypothetical protein